MWLQGNMMPPKHWSYSKLLQETLRYSNRLLEYLAGYVMDGFPIKRRNSGGMISNSIWFNDSYLRWSVLSCQKTFTQNVFVFDLLENERFNSTMNLFISILIKIPKGNQLWIFIGRTEAEKTLMLGKIKGKRRRGWQKMRWLDSINGHEFEQTPGDSGGQGSLVCCSPWGCKVGHELATGQQHV